MRSLKQIVTSLFASLACACSSAPAPTPASHPNSNAQPSPTQPSPRPSSPSQPTQPAAQPAENAAHALGTAINTFGFSLFQQTRSTQGNMAFSPASIWTALAMTEAGARAQTKAAMSSVLAMGEGDAVVTAASQSYAYWNDPARTAYTLRVVNRLFGERTYTFERAYLDGVQSRFSATLEPVDFRTQLEPTRRHINQWVEAQTNDRIRDLIPAGILNADSRLVLANAVYFLGTWQEPFREDVTRPLDFHVSATETIQTPTMTKVEALRAVHVDQVDVVAIPYKGGDFEMILMLPSTDTTLAAVEQSLDAPTFARYIAALSHESIALSLPRFTIDQPTPTALRAPLTSMGMGIAFDAARADFTGIANPPAIADRLVISEVLHKAFVKVDERGTEAAAATAVLMTRGGGRPTTPRVVRFDRPFLFMIRETNTGAAFFIGRVSRP